MALPATADFTGTNGDSVPTADSNFTAVLGTLSINTNSYYSNTSSAPCSARWNADTFDDAQYSEAVMSAVSTGTTVWVGVSVRNQSAASTYYALNVSGYTGTDTYLVEVTTGNQAVIASTDNDVWATTDTVRLEIDGSTLTPLRNGSQISGLNATYPDASITSGDAGVSGYGSSTTNRFDTWEGGNLAAGTSINATSDTLTLTEYQATITAASATEISATSDALTVTTYPVKIIKPFTSDTFDGTGALDGDWYAHQDDGRVDNIQRQSGYFDGDVTSNVDDITEWYNALTGTYHYKTVNFPATSYKQFIIRGVGIGPTTAPQDNLTPSGSGGFAFTGVMCHVDNDFSTPSYQFAVVGHRGGTTSTVELKSTDGGTSSVGDEGTNVFGTGVTHGDFRLRLHSDSTVTYDRSPLGADTWTAMTLPAGNTPTFGSSVNIGMIIYAEGELELPFTGSIDSFEETDLDINISATSDTLALTAYQATITTDANTEISATSDALTLAEYTASISAATSIVTTVDALALTAYTATITTGLNVAATSDSLTLTPFNATIQTDTSLTTVLDALTLTAYTASITSGAVIYPDAEGLEYTLPVNKLGYDFDTNRAHYDFNNED